MGFKYNIKLIEEEVTLVDIWSILELEGDPKPGAIIQCPCCKESDLSCAISEDGKSLRCNVCHYSAGGIKLYRTVKQVTLGEACEYFYDYLGIPQPESSEPKRVSFILPPILEVLSENNPIVIKMLLPHKKKSFLKTNKKGPNEFVTK